MRTCALLPPSAEATSCSPQRPWRRLLSFLFAKSHASTRCRCQFSFSSRLYSAGSGSGARSTERRWTAASSGSRALVVWGSRLQLLGVGPGVDLPGFEVSVEVRVGRHALLRGALRRGAHFSATGLRTRAPGRAGGTRLSPAGRLPRFNPSQTPLPVQHHGI